MESISYTIIAAFLTVMNITSFIVYGADKNRAQKNKFRISEKTLITLAAAGGAIGAFAAMRLFHHKTNKSKFSVGVPVILAIQILIAAALYFKFCFL